MELTEIGRSGRPHGIRGELKLFIEDVYVDDFSRAKGLLIGSPPVPYFIERMTWGGQPPR